MQTPRNPHDTHSKYTTSIYVHVYIHYYILMLAVVAGGLAVAVDGF